MERFGVCLIQTDLRDTVKETVENAVNLIRTSVAQYNPRIVALSECFITSYDPPTFQKVAESIHTGFTCTALRDVAKELKIYVIGGVIELDEVDANNVYNTAVVWDPNGELVARHRKAHLCVNKNNRDYDEASYVKPGNEVTTFDMDNIKIGLAICYDTFFPEFISLYAKLGCKLMIFANAYGKIDGEMFWHVVNRARALDNQFYVAAVCVARNEKNRIVAYGHSMIVDPFGRIISEAGEEEKIVYAEINLKKLELLRTSLPLHTTRRTDIYKRKEYADL